MTEVPCYNLYGHNHSSRGLWASLTVRVYTVSRVTVVISILSGRGIIGITGIDSKAINFGWFSCKLLCTLLCTYYVLYYVLKHLKV
jgi:hypothetical protein